MTRYIPTKSTKRQNDLKWLNLLHHVHGCFCDCDNGITHTAAFIFEQEKELKFTPPEKDIIKQCLSGDVTTATAGDQGIDGFTGEELETLFNEDADDATEPIG